MVFLSHLAPSAGAKVAAKLEFFLPTRSAKDRAARARLEAAERAGLISPGRTTLVAAASGNEGISLACMAAAKGYRRPAIVMPASTAVDVRVMVLGFGAELILTDPALGMRGALEKARQLSSSRGASCVCLEPDLEVRHTTINPPSCFRVLWFKVRLAPLSHDRPARILGLSARSSSARCSGRRPERRSGGTLRERWMSWWRGLAPEPPLKGSGGT